MVSQTFHTLILLLLALFTAITSCTKIEEETNEKLNVLFVSIDDLGPNLGVYDNPYIVSPNLDAFANKGTTFRNTYCQAAVCAPSRASLMSGLRPDSTRVWHLGDKFRKLHPNMITMPMHFKDNGSTRHYFSILEQTFKHKHKKTSIFLHVGFRNPVPPKNVQHWPPQPPGPPESDSQ